MVHVEVLVGRNAGSRLRSGVERGESRRSLSDISRSVDARDARPSGVHTRLLVPLAQRDTASRSKTPQNHVAYVELGTLQDHVPVFLVFRRTLAVAVKELVTLQCHLSPMSVVFVAHYQVLLVFYLWAVSTGVAAAASVALHATLYCLVPVSLMLWLHFRRHYAGQFYLSCDVAFDCRKPHQYTSLFGFGCASSVQSLISDVPYAW